MKCVKTIYNCPVCKDKNKENKLNGFDIKFQIRNMKAIFKFITSVIVVLGLILSCSETSKDKKDTIFDENSKIVKDYLNTHLKDPDSYQSIEWSPAKESKDGDGSIAIRHKYRAKNSFGGYEIEEKLFIIKNKKVVEVIDWNGQ